MTRVFLYVTYDGMIEVFVVLCVLAVIAIVAVILIFFLIRYFIKRKKHK